MILKLQKVIRLSLFLLLSAFLVGTAGLFYHVIIGSITDSFMQMSSQHNSSSRLRFARRYRVLGLHSAA